MIAPDNKKVVVISDVHGHFGPFRELLEKVGVINRDGSKAEDIWVCQLGDLMHLGHNVYDADYETLKLSERYVDCQLLGNHDIPGLYDWAPIFAGFHKPTVETKTLINKLGRDFFHAAAVVDDTLVTHAGISPYWLKYEADLSLDATATDIAGKLNHRLEMRCYRNSARDMVLEAVSNTRGGLSPIGGIFWQDWTDIVTAYEQFDCKLPQMVGHTPLRTRPPNIEGPLIGIDSYGITEGPITAAIRMPGQTWEYETVTRHERY